jgi:hypothetical protein
MHGQRMFAAAGIREVAKVPSSAPTRSRAVKPTGVDACRMIRRRTADAR